MLLPPQHAFLLQSWNLRLSQGKTEATSKTLWLVRFKTSALRKGFVGIEE